MCASFMHNNKFHLLLYVLTVKFCCLHEILMNTFYDSLDSRINSRNYYQTHHVLVRASARVVPRRGYSQYCNNRCTGSQSVIDLASNGRWAPISNPNINPKAIILRGHEHIILLFGL